MDSSLIAGTLALLLIPVCYILTMATFGAYLKHIKAIPIVAAFIVALAVFAALMA